MTHFDLSDVELPPLAAALADNTAYSVRLRVPSDGDGPEFTFGPLDRTAMEIVTDITNGAVVYCTTHGDEWHACSCMRAAVDAALAASHTTRDGQLIRRSA